MLYDDGVTEKTKMNQKGFAHLQLILIATLVIVAVGFTGIKVLSKNNANVSPTTKTSASSKKPATSTKNTTDKQSVTTNASTSSPTSTSSVQKKTTTNSSSNSPTQSKSSNSGGTSPNTPPPTNTNPTITILSPTSGQVITGNDVIYNCSYTTPAGFSEVEASTVDQNGQDADTSFTQGEESAGCENDMDITYLANGTYTATFTIHDSAGKTASASTTFVVQH